MTAAPIRVLLVEDHPLFRHGLKTVLEEDTQVQVVGEASSCADARSQIQQLRPDVVMLDLSLVDGNGNELLKDVTQISPHSRCIVLSAHVSRTLLQSAMENGARGYVSKESAGHCALTAIKQVVQGEVFFGPRVSEYLAGQLCCTTESNSGYDGLTPREQEVFRLAAEGLANKEIAYELGVSRKTVDAHRASIMRKLGLDNQVQLHRLAGELGIIDGLGTFRMKRSPGV